jgi:GNAT superfamily N-acetyltransferase
LAEVLMGPIVEKSIVELKSNDFPEINRLVSAGFGYRAPHSYFDDFPVWNSSPTNIHQNIYRFGIFENTQLVSHVGLRIADWAGVPSGLIGAVATDAGFRGQGLSSALMQHAIEFSKKCGLKQLMLWGSEHQFYSKFGFSLQGEQCRVSLKDLIASSSNLRVQNGYQTRMLDWLVQHPEANGIPYRAEDEAWLPKHQTVQWFWTDQPFAFAGLGRGLDLPHMVHEHGGDPLALQSIFKRILEVDPQAELLTQAQKLNRTIPHLTENLGLYCRLDPNLDPNLTSNLWISGLQAC